MTTTQITKSQLNLFVVAGKAYLNMNQKKKSRLWIAIDALLPKATKLLKRVENERELVRVNLCKKTGTKHIEYDKDGRYQFTEEAFKMLQEKLETIDEQLVAVPSMIIPKGEYPELGLSYDMRQAFENIVIPAPDYKLDDPELDAKLEAENKQLEAEEEEALAEATQ